MSFLTRLEARQHRAVTVIDETSLSGRNDSRVYQSASTEPLPDHPNTVQPIQVGPSSKNHLVLL